MMETLDQYLADQFHSDRQDLVAVERAIGDTCKTLSQAYEIGQGWPYRVRRGAGDGTKNFPPMGNLSQSTTAMVALSLYRLMGQWHAPEQLAVASNFPPPAVKGRADLKAQVDDAANLLLNNLKKEGAVHISSTTYGDDDPLTLSFISNLCLVADLPGDWEAVRVHIKNRCDELTDEGRAPNGWAANHRLLFGEAPKGQDVVPNAILPLRVVQASRVINKDAEQDLPAYRAYFETTLHNQLSFISIPDSRFDPAELAFCLEGLLLSQRHAVDRSLFRRALDVLTQAQQESAFWRPTKPLMATERGFSLFPVSVEVANSLLRSCEIFDGAGLFDTFGSSSIPLFRRYWQWLRARMVRFQANGLDYIGWHSEHINESGVIDIWATSQVLEFLTGYHALLQNHIARTTLIRSRFDLRSFEANSNSTDTWRKKQANFEPVIGLGEKYAIYDRIGKDFVAARAGGDDSSQTKNYSMLLYGPPGTGKTTVARSLAEALSLRMITITVSDFLASGGGQIEARAKAIFDVLIAQSSCVVLFDEIDNLLLDRDSMRYGKQDTAFQFMTPGMLTKLNDLRQSERVIFIIATNYENRIDPAIKRPGRIDQHYLVLPPDMTARTRILKDLLPRAGLASQISPSDEDWKDLAKASVFLGYKEIEGAMQEMKRSGSPSVDALAKILERRARTTDLSIYGTKLAPYEEGRTAGEEKAPLEEFLCMLALGLEAEKTDSLTETAVDRAKERLGETASDIRHRIEEEVPGLNPDYIDRILERLTA